MTATYGVWRLYDQPYFTGTASTLTRGAVSRYDIVINGRGYMIDWVSQEPFVFESIPLLKAMFLQDRGTIPIGEHSLNPQDYWRRSVDDWGLGMGQLALDHSDSVNNQYRTSKGIDPWTAGQFTMLRATTTVTSSADTRPLLQVAGNYLYHLTAGGGNVLRYTTDLSTWTTVTVGAGDTALAGAVSMTADGHNVYVAGSVRVHYTTRGTATYNKFHTTDHVCTLIRFVKDRLLSAYQNTLYTHTLTAGSAVAAQYFIHPNTDWQWTDIAGGPQQIYAAGYSGDQSQIYGITILSDATALNAPVVVATLPSGELVQSLYHYLNVLFIGTNKGLRMALLDAQGNLTLGGLIKTPLAPLCFEGQDRFVWFGLSDFDTTSTGLGRADLSQFGSTAGANVPAYASDLMVTGAGNTTAVVTFLGRRVFAVGGLGVFAEDLAHYVATASISSGSLNFALADNKLLIKSLVSYHAGAGSFSASVAVDGGNPIAIGAPVYTTAVVGGAVTIFAPQMQGRNFDYTLALKCSNDATSAPVIDRWTLMVEPQPERRFQANVPLLLHSKTTDRMGLDAFYSAVNERRLLRDLCTSREIVLAQDRDDTWNVIVDDLKWHPYEHVGARRAQGSFDGTLIVTLKLIN